MGARWANIGGQGGDSSKKSSRIYVKNGKLAFRTSRDIRQALVEPSGSWRTHFGSFGAPKGDRKGTDGSPGVTEWRT